MDECLGTRREPAAFLGLSEGDGNSEDFCDVIHPLRKERQSTLDAGRAWGQGDGGL